MDTGILLHHRNGGLCNGHAGFFGARAARGNQPAIFPLAIGKSVSEKRETKSLQRDPSTSPTQGRLWITPSPLADQRSFRSPLCQGSARGGHATALDRPAHGHRRSSSAQSPSLLRGSRRLPPHRHRPSGPAKHLLHQQTREQCKPGGNRS